MPKIYVKTQHGSQEGYNDNAGALYKAEGWNYGVKDTRVGLVRFSHVPVPKGSTINSATLHVWFSVKTAANSYNFVTSTWYDSNIKSNWLSTTRSEWDGRTWVKAAGQVDKTVTWVPNGASRQSTSVNIKPTLDVVTAHANWTLAGGSLTILMGFGSVSSPDNIYFHRREEGFPPVLEIDYTPPVSDGKETVVNIQENCTFTGNFPWAGQPAGLEANAPHGFTSWFDSFVQPTYVINAAGGPAAPKGGNVLRVASGGTGSMRSMVHFGVPNCEEGQWYNYSAYVWVPAGSPNIQMTPLGDRAERLSSFATMTEKGEWKRQEFSFIAQNGGIWGCIQQVSGGPAYSAGSVFYVANVQLTKGRQLRPYIDGGQTLANADYGWAGTLGTNGFVRAVAPTVTTNTIIDQARRKYYGITWNYANSAGHPQFQAEVQIRRVRQ